MAHETAHDSAHDTTAARDAGTDVNVQMLAIILVFTAVAFFLIVVAIQALFYNTDRGEELRKLAPSLELQATLAEQNNQINGYRWINEPQQTVSIPIEKAKELVVARYQAVASTQTRQP